MISVAPALTTAHDNYTTLIYQPTPNTIPSPL